MVHLFAAMLSLLSLTFGPVGAASAGTATDLVKSKQSTLFELLKQDTPANQKKIAGIFDEMLDYGSLAESSLGSEWAVRTEAERAEFTGVLKELVRKAYERNLKKTLNFNIEYVSEKSAGNATTVTTRASSKTKMREEPLEIAYRLVEKGGAWRVQDIVTEGVSLVSSYRSQFTRIIKKDGFPALIRKMKDKLAKGEVAR